MINRLVPPMPLLAAAILAACRAAPTPELPPGHLPVEIETADVLLLESYPEQVVLHVRGMLPNPCAEAEWDVVDPGPAVIEVEVYGVAQGEDACIQVLAPFEVSIPLGTLPAGGMQIVLNGESVAEAGGR